MQAVRFFIAGIVLHQSLSGHVFLYRRLTTPAMSVGRHAVRVATHSSTVLSFRCGCGSRCFVAQQIGLLFLKKTKMISNFWVLVGGVRD